MYKSKKRGNFANEIRKRMNYKKLLHLLWYPIKKNATFMVFMYALGVISIYATLPEWLKGKIYENTYYELFFDLYIISAMLSCLPEKVRRWVRRVIYAIAYALAVVDTFCFVKFGATINQSMIILLRETTGSETSEFLETYLTWDVLQTEFSWVVLLIAAHLLWTIAIAFAKKRHLTSMIKEKMLGWMNESQRKVTGMVAGLLLSCGVIAGIWCGWDDTMTNKTGIHKLMTRETIGDVEKTLLEKPHGEMYQPAYRLAFSIYCNNLIDKQLDRIKELTKSVEVDSCSHDAQNIVVIIGESYNKHHSQLYGYEKATTPMQVEMEKSGRLTKLNNVSSPWNLTSFVFKHLMTTYCVGDEGDWCDYPLFCQLFRKAGYEVNFLTNQFVYHAKDQVYDASGGFFLNDEELSKAQFTVRNQDTHLWDEDLLKDYERLVTRPTGNGNPTPTLNIFHLMGQHVNYRIRCPKSRQRFAPEDYNLPQNTKKEVRNIAYYDSSLWYNDSVVAEIVNTFNDDDAIIIYFPDHGEEVYGPGSLHHCGRRHTTNITKDIAEQEYEIPMWIYCTDKYAQGHPEVVKAVKDAANKPFMIDAISHTLMGLAGIKSKYYKPQYDLLNAEYDSKRERLMQHAVDFNKYK